MSIFSDNLFIIYLIWIFKKVCILLYMASVQFQFIHKISLEGEPPGTQVIQLILLFGSLILNTRLFFLFPNFKSLRCLCCHYITMRTFIYWPYDNHSDWHLRVINQQQILLESFEKVDIWVLRKKSAEWMVAHGFSLSGVI